MWDLCCSEKVDFLAPGPKRGQGWLPGHNFVCKLLFFLIFLDSQQPGRVAQSVTCLAIDASLPADPGVESLIPVRSHTFVEIDHEMISMVMQCNGMVASGLMRMHHGVNILCCSGQLLRKFFIYDLFGGVHLADLHFIPIILL